MLTIYTWILLQCYIFYAWSLFYLAEKNFRWNPSITSYKINNILYVTKINEEIFLAGLSKSFILKASHGPFRVHPPLFGIVRILFRGILRDVITICVGVVLGNVVFTKDQSEAIMRCTNTSDTHLVNKRPFFH